MQKKGVMFPLLDGVLQALEEVDSGRSSLDDVLDDSNIINPEMRRTAAHWLFSCYRYRVSVEKFIRDFASKSKIKKPLFRLALAGAVHCAFQDRIAREAVVNAIVEYAKIKKGISESRFINAFLRKICRENVLFTAELPDAVAKKWRKIYGDEFILQAEKCLSSEPVQTFRLRHESGELSFDAEKISDGLLKRFVFCQTHEMGKCLASECFANGGIYIQDSAAGTAVELLAEYVTEEKGNFIDVCGAPGGKAIMFYDLFPQWQVFIGDRSARRQQRTAENLERCKVNAEILCLDAAKDKFDRQYDVVFADVPCSNSGVFRKRPDTLFRQNAEGLNEIVQIQRDILENVSHAVKVGGLLLYSTCSIEPEEDGLQIKNFCLSHSEFEFLSERLTLPAFEHDGAYCACLRRKNDS
ncbi:MAG: hypothetical protein IKA22_00075 [Lentisphaeria bacterium]|nr:hypothetical protein [Lentisphaeria bacterium]